MSDLERGKSLSLFTGSPETSDRSPELLHRSPELLHRSNAFHLRERQPRALISQRSWQIRWSRNGIAIGYSRYESAEGVPSVRRHFAPSSLLLLLAASVGIVALAAMASRTSGDGGHYLLSIDAPDRTPARYLLPPPRAPADEDKVEVIRPVATLARPEPERSRPADEGPADDLQPEPDVAATQPTVPDGIFTAEGPAVAAALSGGQVQSWQDKADTRRGFVVVGASERDGDRTCRDLTILDPRDDEENNITRQRKCRDGTQGAWR